MILLLSILLCVTVGLLGASVYANINSMNKIEEYESFCSSVLTDCRMIIRNMTRIDENGAFKSDDEVGAIFDDLMDEILKLSRFVGDI